MVTQHTDLMPAPRAAAASRGDDFKRVLEELLQPVEQGIVILDNSLDVLFANRSALGILAAPSAEDAAGVIARNCPAGMFEACRGQGSCVTYIDVTLADRESRKLLGIEARWTSLPDGTAAYYLLIHDFSRWKKLDELRLRFATSLSHRMRTPLTAVRNAVGILSRQPLAGDEKERLLEIGWRNVEKLIASLDELQKIFMIESEEVTVCRTLTRLRGEIRPVFERLAGAGKVRGQKIALPDLVIFAGRGRLQEFITAAVETYATWLGAAPFIECSSSVREELLYRGVCERSLKLYLRPRTSCCPRAARANLKDFLSFHEAHRGLVLDRLATALGGALDISRGSTICLTLPLDPPFDREKDLVGPLHMMTERADLTGGRLGLVELRLVGATGAAGARAVATLEKVMSAFVRDEHVVARGERAHTWSHFVTGRSLEELDRTMQAIQRRFLDALGSGGEEMIPSLRWEMRYNRSSAGHASVAGISVD